MLKKLKNLVIFHKWAITSGIMIGTTFIPFPPWALLFCFVPLWYFWWQQKDNLKNILISGFITQFLLTLIGFNWVAHTLTEFGHLPFPLAVLGLIGFCGFANLHIPIGGALWFFIHRKFQCHSLSRLLLLPLTVGFMELVFPMIFDWHFGYTWLWAGLPGIHTAEIWGTKFLSTFGIFLNVFFLYAVLNLKSPRKVSGSLALALGLFVAVNVFGWILKNQVSSPDSSANVLIVQANIGNLEKQFAEQGRGFREHIANEYFTLTKQGFDEAPEDQHPDFAVWPETAFPVRLHPTGRQTGLGARLKYFLRTNEMALFAGSYGHTQKGDGVTNSLFYFNKEGDLQTPTYSKTTLLAFGEYIPGGEWFPFLYDLLPQVAQFTRGQGPTIQNLNNIKMGPQICYEGLFDWFVRGSARKGAEIIINVTNDSWYGTWQQPYQHLFMTLSRAIEVRRPLIRSTNTGISTVILADGTILELSPLHKKWKYLYNVPYLSSPPLTLFSRWGYWFPYLFLTFLGALIFGIQRSHTD